MAQLISCLSISNYGEALTKGKRYEMLAHDVSKRQVKLRGDNKRSRWFPDALFDLTGGDVPLLTRWYFNEPVYDKLNGLDETNNWVVVTLEFSDGTTRSCNLTTPDFLKQLLEPRTDPAHWHVNEPAVWSPYLIVMRDLSEQAVDFTLRYLDQQNELFAQSELINNGE